MKKLLRGAVAGFTAAVPMMIVMEILHRLPWPERKPLPPHQITMKVAEAMQIKHSLDEAERRAATTASHFGYGAATGALYAPLAYEISGHPVLKGAAYGLFVWLVSYLGWVPALHILPPATEHSTRRNMLMITAHLVWGASLGMLTARIRGEEHDGQ